MSVSFLLKNYKTGMSFLFGAQADMRAMLDHLYGDGYQLHLFYCGTVPIKMSHLRFHFFRDRPRLSFVLRNAAMNTYRIIDPEWHEITEKLDSLGNLGYALYSLYVGQNTGSNVLINHFRFHHRHVNQQISEVEWAAHQHNQ